MLRRCVDVLDIQKNAEKLKFACAKIEYPLLEETQNEFK